MERRVRVAVKGTVTGVGFRYSTLREASRFPGLQGYVRNKDGSTVECVIQGAQDDVASMIQWLNQGPPSAQVVECSVEELPVDGNLSSFHVR